MRKGLVLILSIVLLILSACTSLNSEDENMILYDKFHLSIERFIENYSSDNYKFISPEQLTITVFGLPDSEIDSSQDGSINNRNNITLLDMYFIDNDESTLIKANFMFFPSNQPSQFLAINNVENSGNSNLLPEYHNLDRQNFIEYIVYYENSLIVLNAFDLKDNDFQSMIDSKVEFYKEFEEQLIEAFKET